MNELQLLDDFESNEYWLCMRCQCTFDLAEEGTFIRVGFICGQCWKDITAEQREVSHG